MEKKYYSINTKNRTITVDLTVQPTRADETFISLKQNEGYTVRVKSQVKSSQAKKRAEKENLTKEVILKALEKDEANTKKFNEVLEDKGFFAAKSWYKTEVLKQPKKTK